MANPQLFTDLGEKKKILSIATQTTGEAVDELIVFISNNYDNLPNCLSFTYTDCNQTKKKKTKTKINMLAASCSQCFTLLLLLLRSTAGSFTPTTKIARKHLG